MDIASLQSTLLYLLAIPPLTLLACIISSSREHFTDIQKRTQLLRIYKHHAILIELLQYVTFYIVLRPLFPPATPGITTSGLLCSLVIGIANLLTLIAMNTIDAWRLPHNWDEVFDPMFRLTRDQVYDCRFSIDLRLSLWLEWLTVAETGILPRPLPAGPVSRGASAESKSGGSDLCGTSCEAVDSGSTGTVHNVPDDPRPEALSSYSAAQDPKLEPIASRALREPKVRCRETTPPPAPPLPKISKPLNLRPRYEGQTLSSASRSVKVGAK